MSHLFIDESKASGYVLVAVAVAGSDVAFMRREITKLRRRGQSRVHFVKEDDSRRREIISKFVDLRIQAHVFRTTTKGDAAGREACIEALVGRALAIGIDRLVFEKDESIEDWDRKILFRELERRGARSQIIYEHEIARNEPLLWIPDGIAWCYSRGRDWKRRIEGLIISETEVRP
jgi:hypothetical protein